MSTRGLVGFVIDDQEKLAYNHSDSYPEGLGVDVLRWLRSLTGSKLSEARDKAQALRLVTEEGDPNSPDSWYWKLHDLQGDPQGYLDAGVMEDYASFALASLFCEWAYVIDFDRTVLEVYRGFQREEHHDGRFADRPPSGDGYYPVRLVATYSLERLPSDDEFLADAQKG